jgi:hypothetical protein
MNKIRKPQIQPRKTNTKQFLIFIGKTPDVSFASSDPNPLKSSKNLMWLFQILKS